MRAAEIVKGQTIHVFSRRSMECSVVGVISIELRRRVLCLSL